jgi:hypothetical protein
MTENYTTYDVKKPSESFLRPDSLIGNVDGLIRGLTETTGREPQPSYNNLVITNNLLIKISIKALVYIYI